MTSDLTRADLEALAARVLDDVEVTNRRGQRTLEHIKEFRDRFITQIVLEQIARRSQETLERTRTRNNDD